MIVVREAVESDIPRVVEMGRDFLTSTKYAQFTCFNSDAMAAVARLLINDENKVLFVAEKDGAVVGMLGLMLYPHPLSGEPFVGELCWWVEPSSRGRIGMMLLVRGERWAKDSGAFAYQMIAPTPEVASMYERLGFTPVEVSYYKRLRDDETESTDD